MNVEKAAVERLVRNVLARAIEDDVVNPSDRDDPDPESLTAEDLTGAVNVVMEWLQARA